MLAGVPSITNDPELNKQSQNGAVALAEVNKGLNHGLIGVFDRPNNIPELNWEIADNATKESNLTYVRSIHASFFGTTKADEHVSNLVYDGGVPSTGYRSWILSRYIGKYGFGLAKSPSKDAQGYTAEYGAMYGTDSSQNTSNKAIVTWPTEGIFPIEYTSEKYGREFFWSIMIPSSAAATVTETSFVEVLNKTTNKAWKLSQNDIVTGRNWGGHFTLSFSLNGIEYVEGDEYQVTMRNIQNLADYSYSFKLFQLGKKYELKAPEEVVATSLTVSPTSASVAVGSTRALTGTVSPTNTTNKTITWSTSNTNVATVSTTGVVTGKGVGTATITGRTHNGKTATTQITVTK